MIAMWVDVRGNFVRTKYWLDNLMEKDYLQNQNVNVTVLWWRVLSSEDGKWSEFAQGKVQSGFSVYWLI
jgi:hypothetical protein